MLSSLFSIIHARRLTVTGSTTRTWNVGAAMTDDAKRFISPLDFVEKYHDRVFSIHLKDRTTKAHGAKNLPFGTGDTPLKELFPFLQKKGYRPYCDIELEYRVPKDSTAAREVGICNAYCRAACGC